MGFKNRDDAGAYVDPMHMTIEGGVAGWELGLDGGRTMKGPKLGQFVEASESYRRLVRVELAPGAATWAIPRC